ncbi:methyl-accepting chemotaxis protein [Pseudomonas matsuisoli]|uniref:Methyl-accepting chemotaxis protein n=2 Tax=Pseudomonas matsuisoli TaxID=1515666 RepID=A0A917Q0K9_9PSED|nr:methyl-accepting chemotaxis protein [Pseudomonas matsuisoli]
MTRSRISLQLAAVLALVLLLLISASTLFALHSLGKASISTREEHLHSEARLIVEQLSIFHGELRANTQKLASLFENRFTEGLRVSANETVNVAGTDTPTLYLGSYTVLNNDFALVDEFRELTGGTATVFVRSGDDFTRITTSLTKQDGSRAIGTQLDRAHPAYALLLKGEAYVGRAVLFGRNYMTQYTPVRDAAGKVIAVLYVGFDYTDAQNQQFAKLGSFRIGSGGTIAILDEKNQWLIPQAGVSLDAQSTNTLVEGARANPSDIQYSVGGKDFVGAAATFSEGPWTVFASLPMDEVNELTRSVGWQLVGGNLLAMLIAVGAVGWYLRRRLRPLGLLVAQAQALGAGNLHARSAITSRDEVGDLATSFNQMGEALMTMVERIRDASSQVSERSRELAALSGDALAGIEQQAGELTSMAGAVEQFSATSQNIAENMRTTQSLASQNAEKAQDGQESMSEASSALQQIAESLAATNDMLGTLGQRSQQIGGIVGVITSIAEQTNLLALNAAIEAARAGEQGRGFAVVADEVRSLAARTREATTEISEMIGTIQSETGTAIDTMRRGNQMMEEGLQLNAQVAEALSQITRQTMEAGEQFTAITQAAHEQSTTSTVLSGNLQGVDSSNRQQRGRFVDLDRTANELEKLASNLIDEVKRFR